MFLRVTLRVVLCNQWNSLEEGSKYAKMWGRIELEVK
jgi:hypothetical protein